MTKGTTEDAIQSLVDGHREFLGFLSRRLSSPSEAEDLLQKSLLTAIEKKDSLREGTSAVSWFYRILRNGLIDHYRSRASESAKYEDYLHELQAEGATEEPSPGELKDQVCACFRRLLPSLKPEYAEVLRRVDLEEKPIDRAAAELGITPNNLMVRLHRARQALRTSLVRSCGTCTEHGCLDCTCGD